MAQKEKPSISLFGLPPDILAAIARKTTDQLDALERGISGGHQVEAIPHFNKSESEKVIENGRRPSGSFSLIDLDAIQVEPVFSELDCSVSKNMTVTGDERPSLLMNSRDILFKTVAQFVSNALSEWILTLVNDGKVSSI